MLDDTSLYYEQGLIARFLPELQKSSDDLDELLLPFETILGMIRYHGGRLNKLMWWDEAPYSLLSGIAGNFGFPLPDAKYISESERRDIVRQMISIWKLRGTKGGINLLLDALGYTYTWSDPTYYRPRLIVTPAPGNNKIYSPEAGIIDSFSDEFSTKDPRWFYVSGKNYWKYHGTYISGTGDGFSTRDQVYIYPDTSVGTQVFSVRYNALSGTLGDFGIVMAYNDINNLARVYIDYFTEVMKLQVWDTGSATTDVIVQNFSTWNDADWKTGPHTLQVVMFEAGGGYIYNVGLDNVTIYNNFINDKMDPTNMGLLCNGDLTVYYDDWYHSTWNTYKNHLIFHNTFTDTTTYTLTLTNTPTNDAYKQAYIESVIGTLAPQFVEITVV